MTLAKQDTELDLGDKSLSGGHTRRVAAELLGAVLDQGRLLDDSMDRSAAFEQLSGSDRGFARLMVSTVLRYLGRIDAGLQPLISRPIIALNPDVRSLLRLGAAQSWVLGTPDYAVVGASVDAAKAWPSTRPAVSLINAVLRRVVSETERFEAQPLKAIWPDWLWNDISQGLGKTAATQMITAQTQQPRLQLTPRAGDPVALAERLGGRVVGRASIEIDTIPVEDVAGFKAGDWWVQDVAAALPAQLLCAKASERVLDLCAAPGGKTMQLAASGARVTALDRSKPRLKRLRENLKRTGFSDIDIVAADATAWRPEAQFDRVLLDAPCSALGTLRRHPEGAAIKTAADISRFPDIQGRLLAAAAEMIKPGGVLVYCVCSPRPEEGVEIVTPEILAGRWRRHPIVPSEVPGFETTLTPDGDVLTLPQAGLVHDAFYIARLVRSAA